MDEALRRLGSVNPTTLLQFMRGRLEQSSTIKKNDPDYDALPYEFHFALEGLNQSPRYPALIRELREWTLDAGGKLNTLAWRGAQQLRQLCANQIDHQLESALLEWCSSRVEHQRAVALILREFSDSDRFHSIALRLLSATADKVVQAHLSDATFTIKMAWGSPIPVYEGRLASFESWTTNAELPARTRAFARRMTVLLKEHIEGEVLREAEDDLR